MNWEIVMSNVALVSAMMGGLWLWSVVRRDASVVDPWWSMGFFLVGCNSLQQASSSPAKVLLLLLLGAWAFRLWSYLLWRSWGAPEDPRYAAFRQRYGQQRYWWVSLFQVFGLQGALILILSLPLQLAFTKPLPDPISGWDLLGAGLILLGLTIESLADAQLSDFRRRRQSPQEVLDSGLWRYSRHPNYFGEAVVWWGFWLSTLDAGWIFLTIWAPLTMTWLLLKVSGVAMLEPQLEERKPAYADYVRRTSAFLPWPPEKKEETPRHDDH